MAIAIQGTYMQRGNREAKPALTFVLDSTSDKTDLPAAPVGSVAYTADLAHIYIYSPSGSWEEAS